MYSKAIKNHCDEIKRSLKNINSPFSSSCKKNTPCSLFKLSATPQPIENPCMESCFPSQPVIEYSPPPQPVIEYSPPPQPMEEEEYFPPPQEQSLVVPKKRNNTTVIVLIIVLVVLIIILGVLGFLIWYFY